MRDLIGQPFDKWRDTSLAVIERYGFVGDETCGVFIIPRSVRHSIRKLLIIASQGEGWDHVSVSIVGFPDVTPYWHEMKFVKEAFFKPDEWALEYHPPTEKNISIHNGCLHLWRPQPSETHKWFLPIPPPWMVG